MTTASDVQSLYIAYFNRPADRPGLAYWIDQIDNKKQSLTSVADNFSKQVEYAPLANLDITSRVNALYVNLFGHVGDFAGLNYWIDQVNNKGLSIGSLALALFKGATGTDLAILNNKAAAADYFTSQIDTTGELTTYTGSSVSANSTAKVWLATVNDTTTVASYQATATTTLSNIVQGIVTVGTPNAVLTTGIDTIVGSSGNDYIVASLAINPSTGLPTVATLGSFDSVDGGDGIDTLNVYISGASILNSIGAAVVKNVENIVINDDNALTADISSWIGDNTVTLNHSGTSAAQNLTMKGVLSASVTAVANDTVTLIDSGTGSASKLATVTVSGATGGAIAVTSDALTTLNLTNSSGGATVTAVAGTRTLGLNLNAVTGGTITDGQATTLNVNTSGAAITGTTIAAAAAKAVTINSGVATTLTALTTAAATALTINSAAATTIATLTAGSTTSLKITGAGNTTLGSTGLAVGSAVIDASASTGNITVGTAALTLGTGVTYTGSTGNDSIFLSAGAQTKAISLGAGNDTLTLASGTLLPTATIDGGTGTDTLSMNALDAAALSLAATFAGKVVGFENLVLTGATGAQTVDVNALGAYTSVSSNASAGTLTINNLANNGTLIITGDTAVGGGYVANITGAASGTSDVLNLSLTKSGILAAGTVTAAAVETINVTTADTSNAGVLDTLTLSATGSTTVKVTGTAGLNLTDADVTLTNVDASGISKGNFTYTSGALTGVATVKGSATGVNNVDLSLATKAVTYVGGAGVDTITVGTGGQNTITLGAGNDIVVFSAAPLINGNSYSTITDVAKGDALDFTNIGAGITVAGALGAKIALAATAVFQDYLDAATALNPGANATVKWFQFTLAGVTDTYVVVDNSAAATYQNGTDFVVKLTGVIDLTTSAIVSEKLTLA